MACSIGTPLRLPHAGAIPIRSSMKFSNRQGAVPPKSNNSPLAPDGAVLDHLGIAVQSLEEAVRFYQDVLGLRVSGYETLVGEKTKVAMLPLGEGRIELLEPTEPASLIARFLAKRGPGLHHVCLRVPDLNAAVARMQQRGMRLVSEQPRVGAGGHRYVFVHPSSAGGVLLELVEEPATSRAQSPERSGS